MHYKRPAQARVPDDITKSASHDPSKLCAVQSAELGSKEAEMRIIGCDLHARQQTISMLDVETGEVIEKTLVHEGEVVREFYAGLPKPVLVGLEATGSMFWFLRLLEELGIEYRVGHAAAIRNAERRKQKDDRGDAALIRRLLVEKRFPPV